MYIHKIKTDPVFQLYFVENITFAVLLCVFV